MAEGAPDRWRRAIAIETSSRQGSVAVLWDGERHDRELARSNAHAKDLLPELRDVLLDVGAWSAGCLVSVDAVVTGTGPGSYTGLRIGIATAKGLARGAGAELLGVPSFEALAQRELSAGESAAIAVDARAARFYFARYRRGARTLETLREPSVLTAEELAGELARDERILCLGEPLRGAGLDAATERKLSLVASPTASSILDLALESADRNDAQRYASTAPLYLRSFGASKARAAGT